MFPILKFWPLTQKNHNKTKQETQMWESRRQNERRPGAKLNKRRDSETKNHRGTIDRESGVWEVTRWNTHAQVPYSKSESRGSLFEALKQKTEALVWPWDCSTFEAALYALSNSGGLLVTWSEPTSCKHTRGSDRVTLRLLSHAYY